MDLRSRRVAAPWLFYRESALWWLSLLRLQFLRKVRISLGLATWQKTKPEFSSDPLHWLCGQRFQFAGIDESSAVISLLFSCQFLLFCRKWVDTTESMASNFLRACIWSIRLNEQNFATNEEIACFRMENPLNSHSYLIVESHALWKRTWCKPLNFHQVFFVFNEEGYKHKVTFVEKSKTSHYNLMKLIKKTITRLHQTNGGV